MLIAALFLSLLCSNGIGQPASLPDRSLCGLSASQLSASLVALEWGEGEQSTVGQWGGLSTWPDVKFVLALSSYLNSNFFVTD